MTTSIASEVGLAHYWELSLRSDFQPEELNAVADDNTNAESGVYASYSPLKAAGSSILRSLNDDAANISAAGRRYEDADAASARAFQ